MKHAFTIVVALLALGVPAAARAQGASGGIRAGINLADLDIDDPGGPIPDSETLTGLVVGVFATVPINRVFSFQPEALYSQQGTKFSEGGLTAKLKVDYLQIPLLGRFNIAAGSPVAVLVGPSLGIRTRAKVDAPGAPPEASEELEDETERFDAGLVAGVAVDVGHFVLDGRYTWGLRNIVKDSSEDAGSAKNRVLSISAGFRF